MRSVELLPNGRGISPASTITVKNLAVAERISQLLETEVDTEVPYFVPYEAVSQEAADQAGIRGTNDVYGSVVLEPEHADKAILHERADGQDEAPDWYEQLFAKAVGSAVLPGYTAFSVAEAHTGYQNMAHSGLRPRIKDPNERSARGQFVVENPETLKKVLPGMPDIANTGVVMEADLDDHSVITVGCVTIGGTDYTWYGKTWDVVYQGEQKFGGNELTLVRGGFPELLETAKTSACRVAIAQTARVVDAYSLCGTRIGRATFDVVQGTASNGEFMSGVTDPSLRPSASSPAEIHALGVLRDQPGISVVTSRVVYDYGKQLTPSTDMKLFASSLKANIFVETTDVH